MEKGKREEPFLISMNPGVDGLWNFASFLVNIAINHFVSHLMNILTKLICESRLINLRNHCQ